jgi:hypothetical protein
MCPLAIEGRSESSVDEIDLVRAMALDVVFEWNASVPAFHAALFGIVDLGSGSTRVVLDGAGDDTSGTSPLAWHLGQDRLSRYGQDKTGLRIEGPSCTGDEPAAQQGVDYTQTVHYHGNVTYSH